jgi:hypothetical protein
VLAAVALLAVVVVVAVLALGEWLRRPVVVGQPVASGKLVSVAEIDHEPWNRLLALYAGSGGVAYDKWRQSATDTNALKKYLESLAQADPALPASREARLAFWINAYNALTVYGILREYPASSIRNFTPRLFGYHIWHDLQLTVGNARYSLHQIEHEQLRPLGEPRVHFAIVCGSRGCPPLRAEAYLPQQLDEQLSKNANLFFANPEHFRFDPQTKQLQVSPILQWFAEDFGTTPAERLKQIAPYLPSDEARNSAADPAAKVEYLDYDWSLNKR